MLARIWHSPSFKQVNTYHSLIQPFLEYRNYDDARKAYLNALKYDKDNQNVLRDLG